MINLRQSFKAMSDSRSRAVPLLPLLAVAWMDILNLVDCKSKAASWRGPNSFILGVPPLPRECHGLATYLGNIYVFGGNSEAGGNNLFGIQ
jgi:hypothetical protein